MFAAFTPLFLILLIPLLVRGAPITPPGTDSGNRDLTIAELMKEADEQLGAIVLESGCMFGLRRGSFNNPIPIDGYYRIPSWTRGMVILRPTGEYFGVEPRRVVRSSSADIIKSRLEDIISIDIRIPMLRVPPTPDNDKLLNAILLPEKSKYHLGTVTTEIAAGQYSKIPPLAVVDTPIGHFEQATDAVVRVLEIDGRVLDYYEDQCNKAYTRKCKKLKKDHKAPNQDCKVFVENCLFGMWNRVVKAGKAVRFVAPKVHSKPLDAT